MPEAGRGWRSTHWLHVRKVLDNPLRITTYVASAPKHDQSPWRERSFSGARMSVLAADFSFVEAALTSLGPARIHRAPLG